MWQILMTGRLRNARVAETAKHHHIVEQLTLFFPATVDTRNTVHNFGELLQVGALLDALSISMYSTVLK